MENKIVMLKIKDTDDGEILETFLVKNPPQHKITEIGNLLDLRYDENGEWNNDWDWGIVYEYIKNNFEIVGYDEEIIDY